MESVIKDRAIRLFSFLRELSELRTKTIRSFETYEQVVWLSDIPLEKGCHVYIWEGTSGAIKDSWIEINKPKLLPPPPIPESVQLWVIQKDLIDSSLATPQLMSTRIVEEIMVGIDSNEEPVKQSKVIVLDDYPEIKKQWESYINSKWLSWAKENRVQKQIQKAYTELYAMYQYQQRMGESYEVALCLGLLTWKPPSGQVVKRHLLTAQTQIIFDPNAGRISVGPSADGPNITLEQDMLEPEERPDSAEINLIDGLIDGLDEDITNQNAIDGILRSWINSIPSSLGYEQETSPVLDVEASAKVTLAPALILRRRTERSLVRAFKEIVDQIKKAESLPSGLEILVKDPEKEETRNGISEHDNPFSGAVSIGQQAENEILFPLPANDEQSEIARQLQIQNGVLVQGPPGTGKSHTIANLVCHLLATGKRVLVTSHTSRALVVLRDKIPKEIAPLCVIALSDDAKSLKALEGSVNGITEKHNNWNPILNESEIKSLQNDLDIARREESKALTDLRAIREAETFKYGTKFGGYNGTLKTIAAQIREDEPQYAWLGILPEEDWEPQLSNSEAVELLSILRQLTLEDEIEVDLFTPVTAALPSHIELANLVKEEQSARAISVAYEDAKLLKEYAILEKRDEGTRSRLKSALENLLLEVEHLSDEAFHWAREAVHQVLASQHLPLTELYELSRYHLNCVSEKISTIGDIQISGLGNRERKTVEYQAKALLSHLDKNGGLGWWKLRPRVVSEGLYLIEETRVDGVLCSTPGTLKALLEWISLNDHLDSLNKAWTSYHSFPLSPVYRVQKAEFESRLSCLSRCLNVENKLEEAKSVISQIPGLAEPSWHNIERIKSLQKVLTAIDIHQRIKESSGKVNTLVSGLEEEIANKSEVHPFARQLISSLESRNTEEYGKLLQKLRDLEALRAKVKRKQLLLSKLAIHVPFLVESLLSDPMDHNWDEKLKGFTSAWNWARADRWIKRLSSPSEQEHINQQVSQLRVRIQLRFAELAAAKAWRYCLTRLTDHESGHLRAWQLAVRRIGRGTGKRVNEYRREARNNLEECRSAIPAWIMPIYRVAETIEMKPDIFDVVIVDEASQSGPEALFLQYIAKKIVVVGDSKQISPQFIGMNKEDVALLRQRLIPDIPYSDALGIEHSFFDQAFIRYKGQICLKEHFRCMPEIIQFSNNLCYSNTPLIPLKQFGAGRLTPTVGTKHVVDGYQKGRSPRVTNPPEAEAVVSFIANCCSDKRYDGKTMGVISLLGEEQGKLIYSLLLEKIGPVELEKRQLICGDAYAFQGDERDVIVLSLVSAPGDHRIGTLTSPDAEKRFNVAASRAREQMWLFHSATLDDLNPECLRYRLLKYCQNPKVEPIGIPGHDIVSLRSLARTVRRDIVRPPIPFDSWFEVDVFLDIATRGYRVIPQLDVAGYRIDLIVEGMRGRLAVECDGDEWHGPEQYERDMARQRQLERSGYVFWRVRGGTYYREPSSAMEPLWETLSRMRILPGAEEDLLSDKPHEPVDEPKFAIAAQESSLIRKASTENTPKEDNLQTKGVASEESHFDLVIEEKPKDLFDYTDNSSEILVLDDSGDPGTIQKELNFDKEFKEAESSEQGQAQGKLQIGIKYRKWVPKTLPDPRTASLSYIVSGLADIVRSEGPVTCQRVYSIYANACGIQRVGKQLRSLFNKAISKAIRDGLLKEINEHRITDQLHKVVRIPECPPVVIRTRGDRTIEEIPPYELAAFMQEIVKSLPELRDNTEELFRAVLDAYGLVRMTTNTKGVLQKALSIMLNNSIDGETGSTR